ncbi:hypothetical protein V8E54_003992 [Elaphomyces granulatus]
MIVEEYIHALSQVEFEHGASRDLPSWSSAKPSDREHVAILDGLALLLVFAATGDVAATTYWQSGNDFTLLWCKNHVVENWNELQYVENLFVKARSDARTDELLRVVIAMCKGKIHHRIRKLAKAIEASTDRWSFDPNKSSHQMLSTVLQSWQQENQTTNEVLDNFALSVRNITKSSSDKQFWQIMMLSWHVTAVDNLQLANILDWNTVRYLNKIADYARILNRFPALLKKLGNTKITIQQVLPPTPILKDVTSGTLEILNMRCEEIPSKEVMLLDDWKMVTDVYEKAKPGVPLKGKKKVRFSQHCEITLALEMLQRCGQRQLSKNLIEIGVSKACCAWCIDYLDLLAREIPKKHPLLLRASHGKQPDGWLMPPNGPKTTTKQMTKLIVGQIDNVVWKIRSRRRSDSNELPAETLGGSGPDVEALKKIIGCDIKIEPWQ